MGDVSDLAVRPSRRYRHRRGCRRSVPAGPARHPASVLVRALLPWFHEIAEAGEPALEAQLDRADRSVALLADDDLGLAVQRLHVLLPLGHGLEIVLAGLFPFLVVLAPVDEHHHVRVLLDRPGLAQVAELRTLVLATFHLARELRERNDGDVEFLGDGLEALRDLRDLVDAVLRPARAAQKLQVVD